MDSRARETYSIQQRDGNVVTTTTNTKYEEDIEYSCGGRTVDSRKFKSKG
jgi:hypothetical protein